MLLLNDKQKKQNSSASPNPVHFGEKGGETWMYRLASDPKDGSHQTDVSGNHRRCQSGRNNTDHELNVQWQMLANLQ